MFAPLPDLAKCRILLCNDDGIAAQGLSLLESIARSLSDDVWVVAPTLEQSGAGQSLTIHHPLRPIKIGEKRYSVTGTPTDTVMVALHHLMKDTPPDLILSGVNHGSNLGEDVHYSGTVAGALEGVLLGVRSIALSQVFVDRADISWAAAEWFAPDLIAKICRAACPKDVLVNVNFPARRPEDVFGVKVTAQGKNKVGDNLILREDPRGRPYLWIGARLEAESFADDSDFKAVDDGFISVTPLNVDLTDRSAMDILRKVL
ncbi:MAG: 5'/3'-nucleotidase SurE [Rhodospirillaceae bacterium]|nr:5'/3'-nucleotidase SurE [Rhodospirillaceae bacterium]